MTEAGEESAALPRGVYETLVTSALQRTLRAAGAAAHVEAAAGPRLAHLVVRHLKDTLERVVAEAGDDRAAVLANALLEWLVERGLEGVDDGDRLPVPVEELRAIGVDARLRPRIPLSTSDLIANGARDLRLGAELEREIACADRIDWICAFVQGSGLRLLRQPLERFLASGRRLRLLTSTYLGVTEAEPLRWLAERGAQIRVSLDGRRTRLHAKAWLFERDSGMHTAYVGSSNLSRSAMVDGLEWNVRLSQADAGHVLERFRKLFEATFADAEFECFDPEAFARARRAQQASTGESFDWAALEVRPYPFQQAILDALAAEREVHGRTRNLVVAATGTGKTVVAALDYQRLRAAGHETLLFVAHREEILRQSRATFRAVLNAPQFGELHVGGKRPEDGRHVFASIQSLSNRTDDELRARRPDVLVVDEFHHAEAATYRRLLAIVEPRQLLGLTATPERADGTNVQDSWFDGRIAAELRLWDALEKGLLCPFHYFGVPDGVDLSALEWRRGRYDEKALEGVYDGNEARVRLVLQELRDKVGDPSRMRALGFCAGIAHARFMAARFTALGIPAAAITGEAEDRPARQRRVEELRRGDLRVLFTVDVFNEGVDIQEVDTLLLLRPTESATVFLQQLGRGLRQCPGKSVVTVLDFVGHAHREFRFDLRYRALLGGVSRREAERQIEDDFPRLPSGCAIRLEREAKEWVLQNVRQGLGRNKARWLAELRRLGPLCTLRAFLREADVDADELYRRAGSFTRLRQEAGLPVEPLGPHGGALLASLAGWLGVDDLARIELAERSLAELGAIPEAAAPDAFASRLRLLQHWRLWRPASRAGAPLPESVAEGLALLRQHPAVVAELRELLALLRERVHVRTRGVPELPDAPLVLHASYSREEILGACGAGSAGAPPAPQQSGVHLDVRGRRILLFVTLEKDEREFGPKTRYRDYAIDARHFHWESQHMTRAASTMGRRYQRHREEGFEIFLFVRRTRDTGSGRTAPFVCLGAVDYVRHEGERPMQITWRLREPMPAALYDAASVAC